MPACCNGNAHPTNEVKRVFIIGVRASETVVVAPGASQRSAWRVPIEGSSTPVAALPRRYSFGLELNGTIEVGRHRVADDRSLSCLDNSSVH